MVIKFHNVKLTLYGFYNVYYNEDLKSSEFNILLHKLFFKQRTYVHLEGPLECASHPPLNTRLFLQHSYSFS